MSDSDDDELAALRAARAARGVQTVTAQRRAVAAERGGGGWTGGGGGGGDGDGGAGGGDLRSHFPAGFGGAAALALSDDDDDDDEGGGMGGGARPATSGGGGGGGGGLKRGRDDADDDDDDEDGGDDDDDDDGDPFALPTTHEAALPPTPRGVSALALDPPGARLLAGSRDGSVQVFDFGTMDAGLAPRRTFTPRPDHPVTALAWSPASAGRTFLAATADPRLSFFDGDGVALHETPRGDPYLRDAKHTAGHTAPITAALWHPADAATVATASEDGTVRLWDASTGKQKTVIKPSLPRPGRRVAVTALTYAVDGTTIVAGLEDGSLHAWDVRAGGGGVAATIGGVVPPPREQMAARPDWRVVAAFSGGGVVERVATGAHAEGDGGGGGAVTALAAAPSATGGGGGGGPPRLASRGGDGTLKIWDLRRLGPASASAGPPRGGSAPAPTPLLCVRDLPADLAGTGVAWSPDGRLVVCAVSGGGGSGDGGGGGALVFADTAASPASDPIIRRLAVPPGTSAIPVLWHRGLNQIFVGTGAARSGGVRVFYSPSRSVRGVVAASGRRPRKPDPADWAPPVVAYAPHALAAFREEIPGLPGPKARKGRRGGAAGAAAEPVKAGPPPPAGAGGGRPAPTRPARTLLTQHLLAGGGALRPAGAEADVREALLAHGAVEGGGGGPRVLAAAEEEEEGE